MKNIFLIGFMGSGKSYAARVLAQKLNLPYFDLDVEIEKKVGTTIKSIFEKRGEVYFRNLETELLLYSNFSGIISTGGGIVESKQNRQFLKTQYCIWLAPPWQQIYSRIKKSQRPLVLNNTEAELRAIYNHRKPLYEACADLVFYDSDLDKLLEQI
jgi:shikimate kinase